MVGIDIKISIFMVSKAFKTFRRDFEYKQRSVHIKDLNSICFNTQFNNNFENLDNFTR